jgi:DNA-3-methyladenine glycosylase
VQDVLLRSAEQVAPRLLGASVTSELRGDVVVVRVVEVEAYAGEGADPASHAHRGRTARNASMFERAGTAYVYFTYGMHWCLNVAVGPAGEGSAVLLRAAAIVEGVTVARQRRTAASGRTPADRDLARGPARLCQALGVTGAQDGLDLLDPGSPLRLVVAAEPASPDAVAHGPRVGVRQAADRPWRFWLHSRPEVSAYRGPVGARRTEGGR